MKALLYYPLFVALVVAIMLFVLGLPLIAFVVYRFAKNRNQKIAGTTILLSVCALLVYIIFVSLFPPDGFYKDEFRDITANDLPADARILKKSASYPDIHGDYCSAALIEMRQADFEDAKNKVKADPRFEVADDLIESSQLQEVIGRGDKRSDYELVAIRIESDHYFGIAFMNEESNVVIHKCT